MAAHKRKRRTGEEGSDVIAVGVEIELGELSLERGELTDGSEHSAECSGHNTPLLDREKNKAHTACPAHTACLTHCLTVLLVVLVVFVQSKTVSACTAYIAMK